MKKTLRLTLLVALTFTVIAGCAGGDDDDDGAGDDDDDGGGFTVTSGNYIGANSATNNPGNTCAFQTSKDDLVLAVTVAGNTVTLGAGGIPVTIDSSDGVTLTGGGVGQAGFTDCTLDATFVEEGEITADDAMHLREVITVSNPVGAGCPAVTYPCNLDYDYDLTKQ